MMNKTIWKQTDSRWAKKAYPSGSTVGGCGCGLLACTHVAMEQERYKNWTPDNLRAWMVGKGFALRGQGTKWEGITETLKYIGHSRVVRIYNDPMSEAWKELNRGNRIGVLLFTGHKAPNGIRWTSSGHYVAFTGYKVENGKHYFYTKDSGGRNHSGWYSYENSMKGCIAKLWIVERVGKQTNGSAVVTSSAPITTYKPSTAYNGSLPKNNVKKGSKGSDAKACQSFLNWCINAKLSVDGIAGVNTVNAIKTFQKTYGLTADGIFGPASRSKAQSIVNQHKPKAPSKPAGTAASSKAALINQKALTYAWPLGTPEKAYKKEGGSPNSAYKAAWKKYFPKIGINTGCHSYVKLVLKDCGYPTMNTSSWGKILKYLRANFTEIKPNFTQSQLQPGDIRVHKNSKGGYHIWIIVQQGGSFYRAEANQAGDNPRYAHINTSNSGNLKKHKGDWLFRAK